MEKYRLHTVFSLLYTGDFTPVCTTEFIAFSQSSPQFEKMNAKLLGLSIDSNPSHLAWAYSIYAATGVQIPFPIIADRTGDISRMYGMLSPATSNEATVRNVFIIDPQQKIRAILIYPMSNGRSIPEILRLLTALQTSDKYKVVTPANWEPGQPVMLPPPKTYEELEKRQNNPQSQNLECNDWFWCYKELPPSNM